MDAPVSSFIFLAALRIRSLPISVISAGLSKPPNKSIAFCLIFFCSGLSPVSISIFSGIWTQMNFRELFSLSEFNSNIAWAKVPLPEKKSK
mgnify:CR=1 FL=1